MKQSVNVKKLSMTAVLAALAFASVALCRIPVVMFLSYEPKDILVTLGGLIFGPMTSLVVSVIVSFIEMVTISTTGWIGLVMNILSTCSFACLAALIYRKKRTLSGAVLGLVSGCLLMTAVMLLWNFLITPIYMGYPRDAVAEMLLPVFLPFNLIKGGINAVLTLLLYQPLVTALRKARLVAPSTVQNPPAKKVSAGVVIACLIALATLILFALVLSGHL